MNYHYRNETFAPRFLLWLFVFFAMSVAAVAIYAETERQRFEAVVKTQPERKIILIGSDTWITITGADRDADVRVWHGGVYE